MGVDGPDEFPMQYFESRMSNRVFAPSTGVFGVEVQPAAVDDESFTVAREHSTTERLPSSTKRRGDLGVPRHTARDREHPKRASLRKLRIESNRVLESQRVQQPLPGSPPIQRAGTGQGLLAHHRDHGTTQNDHHRRSLPMLVPPSLEHAGESRLDLTQVLVLIQDRHSLAGTAEPVERGEKPVPVMKIRGTDRRLTEAPRDRIRQEPHRVAVRRAFRHVRLARQTD